MLFRLLVMEQNEIGASSSDTPIREINSSSSFVLVSCLLLFALLRDAEDGSDGVALGGRDGDSEAVGTLGELHLAIAQKGDLGDLAALSGEGLESEITCFGPCHDGGIDGAFLGDITHIFGRVGLTLVEALGIHGVSSLGQRSLAEGAPHAGAVDTLAIHIHPGFDIG